LTVKPIKFGEKTHPCTHTYTHTHP